MSSLQAIALVARREYVERIRERSFIISTVLVVAFVALFALFPRIFGSDDPSAYSIGLVGEDTGPLAEALVEEAPAVDAEVTTTPLADASVAETQLREDELDLVVVDGERVVVEEEPPPDLEQLVQLASARVRTVAAFQDAGVPADEIPAIVEPQPLPVTVLEPAAGGTGSESVAFFAVFVLYFQLLGYGYWVASGVVEEKSSRIVEILLSTIRPRDLLAGKVIGIGLLGLTQLLGIIGLGLGVMVTVGGVELPPGAVPTIGSVLAWFVLGYSFYSCVFAVGGALVSRQEELQSTTGPMTVILVVAFLFSIVVLNNPASTLARVASFVPPSAPLVMPIRVAVGSVPWVDFVGAVLVTAASAVALVVLAARLYEGAILRTGARVSLRDAWHQDRGRNAVAARPDA